MEQLETCKRCTNRTVTRDQGIVCGLTVAKPTFIDECRDYTEDAVQVKRLDRFEKSYSPREVHKESVVRALTAGTPMLLIGFFLLILPVPVWVAYLGLFLLAIGILFILYAVVKILALFQEPSEAPPQEDSPSKKNDLEVY